MLEGSRGVLSCECHLSLHGEVLHLPWPVAQHLVEGRVGLGVVLEFEVAQHHVVPAGFVLGFQLYDLPVVGDGSLEVLLVHATEPTKLIAVADVGVAVEAECAVLFGSHVVLEVELGQSAEEIRLGEVGLGADDHVEALDAEHIVFVVEGIAPHEHDAVGVDLGEGRADGALETEKRELACHQKDGK